MPTGTGAPASSEPSPARAIVGALPMEQSVEDVLGGLVRFRLAGKDWRLPVLSIGENEAWQEALDEQTRVILADVDENDLEAMVTAVMSLGADAILDVILSYDKSAVLPREPEWRKSVYPYELLPAVWAVSLAANPTAAWSMAAAFAEMRREANAPRPRPVTQPSAPTNRSQRRTAGRRAKSGPN